MPNDLVRYPRYRFSPAIISHAVWLYYRFTLSFRDVEDLLAHRGITVSYESIRHWCETFGLAYARRLRHRAGPVGDTWHLDELFVTIRGQRQYSEVSHQLTRRRESHMRRFKSAAQAQRFLAVHDVVRNLFTVGRHRLRARHQRLLRSRAFTTWSAVAAA